MTTSEGVTLARSFRDLLLREGIPVQKAYLYGSVARGQDTKDSDIDVAVVCTAFLPSRMEENIALWKARRKIDVRIEPICLHPEDFETSTLGIAHEIVRTGMEL
jgi:uncharacterized protein